MIDTVKLFYLYKLSPNLFSKNRGWRRWYLKGSSTIIFSHKTQWTRIIYNCRLQMLSITFSAPIVINGSNKNMVNPNDMDRLISIVDDIIHEAIDIELPSISLWETSRIDFCHNFQTYAIEDKKHYIELAQLASPSRSNIFKYTTSAFVYNKSWSYKIYDKAAEMASRGEDIRIQDEKILRVEVSLRRRKLKTLFADPDGKVLFWNLVNRKISTSFVYDALKRFRLLECHTRAYYDQLLKDKTSTAVHNRLMYFLDSFNSYGESHIKSLYGKDKVNRTNRTLKSLGVESGLYIDGIKSPLTWDINVGFDLY